jgi:hypothetical protein
VKRSSGTEGRGEIKVEVETSWVREITWTIPDWRNPDAYPKQHTRLEWAWEFLRRNPMYQSDWAEDVLSPLKYGLSEPLDPATKPAKAAPFFAAPLVRCYLGPGQGPIALSPTEMAVVIDLTRPIKKQLEEIKRRARLNRPDGSFRAREDHYANYLRAWDARCEYCSWGQIGRILFPDETDPERQRNDAKKYCKAAFDMVWGDYRYLVISDVG